MQSYQQQTLPYDRYPDDPYYSTAPTGTGSPDGSLSAQAGSLFLDQSGATYVNTDGVTSWTNLASGGGGGGGGSLQDAYASGSTIILNDSDGDLVFTTDEVGTVKDFYVNAGGGGYYLRTNAASNQLLLGDGSSIQVVAPGADDAVSLGTATQRWDHIYLAEGSIFLGSETGDEYNMSYDTTNNNLVFNEAGGDYGFRVEGDNKENLFFVDATNDRLGINTNTPGDLMEILLGATEKVKIDGATTTHTDGTAGLLEIDLLANELATGINVNIGSETGLSGSYDDFVVGRQTTVTPSTDDTGSSYMGSLVVTAEGLNEANFNSSIYGHVFAADDNLAGSTLQGTTSGIGMFNYLTHSGSGSLQGTWNNMRHSGSGLTMGSHNEFNLTGSGDSYGAYQDITLGAGYSGTAVEGININIDNESTSAGSLDLHGANIYVDNSAGTIDELVGAEITVRNDGGTPTTYGNVLQLVSEGSTSIESFIAFNGGTADYGLDMTTSVYSTADIRFQSDALLHNINNGYLTLEDGVLK